MSHIAVRDGFTVVTTGAAGRYTLVADPRMPAVFVSTPASRALPVPSQGSFPQHVALDGQREQLVDSALISIVAARRRVKATVGASDRAPPNPYLLTA